MNVTCNLCSAFHWAAERIKHSSLSSPQFSRCCHHGKVFLDPLPVPPEELQTLFTAQSTQAKEFRVKIRQYNSALAFTSFTTNKKDVNSGGGGPWVWKSGYTIYHRAGSLLPTERNPKYAQLYFYDPDEALRYRMDRNEKLNPATMAYLQDMLVHTNRYTRIFLHSLEILTSTPSIDLQIRIVADPSTDLRRYNAPSVNEIAVIIPGENSHAVDPRDIVLHRREGGLQFIHDHHYAYAPLHYVLLFPYGTAGWTYNLPIVRNTENRPDNVAENRSQKEKHISQAMFYSYRLHTRQGQFPIIHFAGRLFQQYICDMWVSTDQNRLRWVENNQTQLRAALYNGLEDAIGHGEGDIGLRDVGHRVVLPSSYIGGPRYMNQRFQDAIALARYYHGFDLFITFTCNAHWPEITNALLPGQYAADRPDLTVRVFNMYKTSLIDELTKDDIFGRPNGYVYTIEFQKRGLPHMHLLLALTPPFRPTSPDQVDTIIKATWPDPEQEPHLFNIVKRSMVHGPCGRWKPDSPCMKEGKCTKGFPKAFQAETVMTKDGYPIYARPDDGRAYEVRGCIADNRWIVPYNPHVLSRYVCSLSFIALQGVLTAHVKIRRAHQH